LGMAASLIETGRSRTILVVGAEILSRIVDPDDRSTVVLFGDGAGAAVLPASGGEAGLLGWDAGCDGAAVSILEVKPGDQWLTMDGREVFRRAVRVVVESAGTALERSGVSADDISLFVPH